MTPLSSVIILVLFRLTTPGQAHAETSLISAPLAGGAGGLMCACTNLRAKPIEVTIKINLTDVVVPSANVVIQPGSAKKFNLRGTPQTGNCHIFRQDRSPVLSKHVSCTLSAMDGNDHPIAVIPVNRKFKIP